MQGLPISMALHPQQPSRTAEMVTGGHPDKFCDQVADAILDATLQQEATGRTAIECVAKGHLLFISGETLTAKPIDFEAIARAVYRQVGYGPGEELTVLNHVQVQSPDIALGVDHGGAGDQGIMVGYATSETDAMLPREYVLARDLCWRLTQCRENGTLPWLRPDGKSQVTLVHGHVTSVILAAHHAKTAAIDEVRHLLRQHVVEPVVGCEVPRVVLNGTGAFTIGGPHADAGVVGRKIVVDAYGPHIPVGGGAYSGKDPSKVDRSAAYMARHIAKTVVAHHIAGAKACTVVLAYGIGQYQPEMVTAITDTGRDVSQWVTTHFADLSPTAIIDYLGLRHPHGWSYCATAAYGHYGRPGFPWETIANVP